VSGLGGFYGVEVGARIDGRLWNLGEVPRCRSRAEAEALGRMLVGADAARLDQVAGFEWSPDASGEGVVSSFSVYYYDGEQTTEVWDYDGAGRCVS